MKRAYKTPHLINRRYGYWQFDCVIDGKIVLTRAQFKQALKKLMRSRKWLYSGHDARWYKRYVLKPDSTTRFVQEGKSRIYNVRVDATKAIAEMFGLKNYKRQNYVIEVI